MTDSTPLLPAAHAQVAHHLPASLISAGGPADVLRAYFDRYDENTKDAYRRDLMVFARFLAEHKAIAPVSQAFNEQEATVAADWILSRSQAQANQVALKYRHWLLQQAAPDGRPVAGSTVDRRLSALKSLVTCGRVVGKINWSLDVRSVGKKASPKTRDVRGPGKDGVRLMAAVLDRRYQKVLALRSAHPHRAEEARFQAMAILRDRAILMLLYTLALRCFEAGGLTIGDVGVSSKKLRVRRKGDGGQSRVLSLPPKTLEHVVRWLKVRGSVDPKAPLFVSLNNQRVGDSFLTEKSIYRVIVNLGVESGQKTWPHGLRHAGITEALDLMKGDVRAVSKFSGHARVDTVMMYDDERRDQQGDIANQVAEGL